MYIAVISKLCSNVPQAHFVGDQTFICPLCNQTAGKQDQLGSFFIHMEPNILGVSVYSLKLFSMASIVWLFGIYSLLFISCGYVEGTSHISTYYAVCDLSEQRDFTCSQGFISFCI